MTPADSSTNNEDEQPRPPAEAVAVVICAYTEERWDDIVAAIESVRSQRVPPEELVLVIDHNDRLLETAARHFNGLDNGVKIVTNRHKQGLSGARNSGIEESSAPIIVFLDDDAVANPGWLDALTSHYEDPDVMGVGGAVEPIWLSKRPRWWPSEFDWVIGCSRIDMPKQPSQIRNPIGANMSVRRRAFESVGAFSSAIGRLGKRPVGCEETEFYIRIKQRWPQSTVMYEPAALVGHKVPATRGTFHYFRSRCYAEGLSKAVVSKLVGSDDGLSDEWTYTLRTLPLGVLRGLFDGLRRRPGGFGRAGAIIAGLFITLVGYVRGRFSDGPERSLVQVPNSSEAA